MMSAERISMMMDMLHKSGFIKVEELSTAFGVSEMTVRRDLEACEKKGLLQRCHGGAMLKPGVEREFGYQEKYSVNVQQKTLIAEKCMELISDGQTVFLDVGTTTARIAERLNRFRDLTVITCDLQIALQLANMGMNVLMLGGNVKNSSYSVYGPLCEKMLRDLWIDVSFISSNFIDGDFYLYAAEPFAKSLLKNQVMRISNRSYLVVDGSKFYRKSLYRHCPLSDFSGVVTERTFTKDEQKRIEKMGVTIIPTGA